MRCDECGAKMYVDDKDYRFHGNYDVYWNCPNCVTSCIQQVRYNQNFKEHWHTENGGDVKDWTIKYPLTRK